MRFTISATWGPTDPTRAALPFIFAASALQAGDTVTLMLFHAAVHIATEGTAANLVPFGPAPTCWRASRVRRCATLAKRTWTSATRWRG